MKSIEYIGNLLKSPEFQPKPYSYADWFCKYLNQELGFYWEDDKEPFKLRSGDIIVTVSPYVNVVIVDHHHRSFTTEKYFHPHIPRNQDEFDEFWKNLQPLL